MGKYMKRGAMMIVTFVTIILIILMGITLGGRARITTSENIIGRAVTPIQRVFYKSGQVIEETFHSLFAFRSISKENELLKKEIQELNKQLIDVQLNRNELDELRSLANNLKYVEDNNWQNYISASVTGKDVGNWFNIFTINVGSMQGVTKDGIVMNGEGLVGRIYEVGANWSKVVTIIDNKSSVSFEVLRNNQYIGVIRGSVNAGLNGYLIDPQAEVLVGDKIITSGLSVYPKGILIGEIKEVIKKENELLKSITIEPAVNFKRIDKVFVVMPD